MRSDASPPGRTFLEEARRAQIVACAIDVLATEGYSRATMARIAERAGVSKSVIVYHFGTKEKVFEQVVAEVFQAATADLLPRLAAESTPRAKLRTYIAGRVGFLASHRAHMHALFEIWMNLRADDGSLRMSEADAESTVDAVEQLLRAGQEAGEFGQFSPRVMAMTVRQAIDGVLLQLRNDPSLDLDEYARELVDLFDRATRRRR
jgi:TetR/AcrR family transcriptional regulator, fatty acid metabolism regulator protein